ncbi:MAG: hypothetical protein KF744_11370 [Taibaiella sp.]|nr:hypothetical protein [Taibaiella sp.]
MPESLKLKQIFVGNVDAKHELVGETIEEKNNFLSSFLMPDNFTAEDYLLRNKYFVTGLKGTGKTALLRYLSLKLEQPNSYTSFVLFKTDFSEEDRKELHKTGKSTIADTEKDVTDEDDYTNTWLWFFYKHILDVVESKKIRVFSENEDFVNFKICLTSFQEKLDEGAIKRVFPKLKKGSFEFKLGSKENYGKGTVEFEWIDSEKKLVRFSALVTKTSHYFKRLVRSNFGDCLTIFIDELELSYGKSKQFNRDIRLIRDLISAIYQINTVMAKSSIKIKLIAAIRSEVLSSTVSAGKEINKIVADFGTPINWHQSGGDIKSHPLFKILYKRILTSEIAHGLTEQQDYNSLWERYFPPQIQNRNAHDYILSLTWYRPRDIIRLLSIGQKFFPNENSFTHQVFDAIKKEYSSDCWIEQAEELKSKFSSVQIDGIRLILTGITSPFNFTEIKRIADEKKELYNEVDELLKTHKLASILNILFQIGIIGNSYPKYRFAFRGDQDLLIDKPMKVHDALYNYLAVEKKEN